MTIVQLSVIDIRLGLSPYKGMARYERLQATARQSHRREANSGGEAVLRCHNEKLSQKNKELLELATQRMRR